MARKTKYGKLNSKKSKSRRRRYTRKYKGRGGCNSSSCALSGSTAPVWTSKGGAHPEKMSEDIYNSVIDPSFYSSA
jgi:hypothetical protein